MNGGGPDPGIAFGCIGGPPGGPYGPAWYGIGL